MTPDAAVDVVMSLDADGDIKMITEAVDYTAFFHLTFSYGSMAIKWNFDHLE